jgi:Family of unknown function (DUF6283)
MRWEIESPCKSCPYRKDSPLALWDNYEFENLLRQDADPLHGAMFGCHATRHRPQGEQTPCAGWLLDQKRRGVPSIQLRIALFKEDALKCFESVHSGGHKLFRTIQSMSRANFKADRQQKRQQRKIK